MPVPIIDNKSYFLCNNNTSFWSETSFPTSSLYELLKLLKVLKNFVFDIQPQSCLRTVLKFNLLKFIVLKNPTFYLYVSKWKRPRSLVQVRSFPHSTSSGPETISLVWNVSHYPSPRHMVAHSSTPTSQEKSNCYPSVHSLWAGNGSGFWNPGVQKQLPDLTGTKGHKRGKNRRKEYEMNAECDPPGQTIAAPVYFINVFHCMAPRTDSIPFFTFGTRIRP